MSQPDPELELLERHINALAEHFDTVQIFVTRMDEKNSDNTVNACRGAGNWFARYGQVQEWLIKSDERTRQHIRAK